MGLAKLQDKDSIPLIIEACEKVSRERALMMAIALVYFDDPRAQAAAETLLDKPVLEERRKRIRDYGLNPFQ
jgi:hypothetical protein